MVLFNPQKQKNINIKMNNFDEYEDTSGLHNKADQTLGYNRTLIWLYIIFFIITLILTFIFVYARVGRIEDKVDYTTNFLNTKAEKAFTQGEEIYTFFQTHKKLFDVFGSFRFRDKLR